MPTLVGTHFHIAMLHAFVPTKVGTYRSGSRAAMQ